MVGKKSARKASAARAKRFRGARGTIVAEQAARRHLAVRGHRDGRSRVSITACARAAACGPLDRRTAGWGRRVARLVSGHRGGRGKRSRQCFSKRAANVPRLTKILLALAARSGRDSRQADGRTDLRTPAAAVDRVARLRPCARIALILTRLSTRGRQCRCRAPNVARQSRVAAGADHPDAMPRS